MKKQARTEVRIQDNLYQHVNGDWIEATEIPDDMPAKNSFSVLNDELEERMMVDFRELLDGEKTTDIAPVNEAVKLFALAKDEKRRAEDGIAPLLPLLEEIKSIGNLSEFREKAQNLFFRGVPMPFGIDIVEDFKNSTKYTFAVMDPPIILPDTAYYEKKLAKLVIMSFYKKMAKKLLKYTPLTGKEQKQYLKDTLLFDDRIRRFALSRTEMADYVKMYNPISEGELEEKLRPFDLPAFLKSLYGENLPERYITANPRLLSSFAELFSEESFTQYIHWAYVNTLIDFAPFLSVEISDVANSYTYKLVGIKKSPEITKQAYRIASGTFSDPVGLYYGRTYFGEEAKRDITSIVSKIIETYKKRISANSFLGEETKKKAISKLSAIKIKMGYSEGYESVYDRLKIEEGDSFFAAMQKIKAEKLKNKLGKVNGDVDPDEWAMPAHMVNACYDPFKNEITFPAAILRPPFYSIDQKPEENLGGIGAVIGHEISHAFDNNGAKFDEFGNLNNWWTDEDFAAFGELTAKMAEQFDGIEYHGGKLNGSFTVSENIADNGGVAVTLDIMSTLDSPDYAAYFTSWAKVWRQKASEAYIKLLLSVDVHSPAELRANMQPRNFSEWYRTFGVGEADGMYIPEDKRIIIW